MSSIKTVLYEHKTLSNGENPVMLYVYEDGKAFRIGIKQSCTPKLWDSQQGRYSRRHPRERELNLLLRKFELKALEIIDDFIRDGEYFSIDVFKERFRGLEKKKETFDSFFKQMMEEKNQLGKIGTMMAYRDALNALKRFKKPILKFEQIDYNLLKGLEVFLFRTGCTAGGIGAYMRSIRAVYYEGIRRGHIDKEANPFSTMTNKNGYSLSKLKSVKNPKAISQDDLVKLKKFDIVKFPQLADTWRYFMFSFYLFGMNFIDMSQLTQENYKNGRVIYIRQKTGKPFNIKVRREAKQILEYFCSESSKYLFPILNENTHQTPQQKKGRTHRVRRKVNGELSQITKILGIETKITFYSARHTSATTMKRNGVSTDIISEALGHTDLNVTQCYLSKFDNEVLDGAIMSL